MPRHMIRRTLTAVTTIALTTVGLAVMPAVAANAAPVTVSAVNFDDGTTGAWSQSGGSAGTLTIVDNPDGTGKVLSVNARSADYVGLQSPTGLLTPGKTYTLSARIRLADGTPDSSARLVVKPAYTWVGNATVKAGAWTTLTGDYTVAADADPSTLQVYIGTSDLADKSAYTYLVDDVTITTPGETPTDPNAPVPGTKVIDTDFESGLDGWAARDGGPGPAQISLSPVSHTGAQAALVSQRPNQGAGLGHDVKGVLTPGQTYDVSAWVRFAEGQPVDSIWLSLQRDSNFSTLGQFSTATNTGWTHVTATFTMGTFTDTALLYFETRYDSGNTGNTSDFLVDDVTVSVPEPIVIQDVTPIKDTVPFPVGVAIDTRETAGAASQLFLKHFDQFTAENAMKPEGWYDADHDFRASADTAALMQFAEDNDLRVYGHVLAWHSQTPAWFFQNADGTPLAADAAGKAILTQRLHDHIYDVAQYLSSNYGTFGGGNPVVAFDVVNEVVADSGDYADGLRRSEWYRILGESFIDLAFQYADDAFNHLYAAPGADRPVKLFINDYNTEQSGKQQRLHDLVARLIARGVPVDGVGHQFHVNLATPVSALSGALEAFEDLPVTQAITELDVPTGTPVSQALLIDQGYYFRDVFRVLRAHADDLFSVTVWGLTDGRSWRSGDGAPLLFNDAYQTKPAYTGVVDGDLPARLRTANVFEGSVPVDAQATGSLDWSKLPLNPIESTGGFQLRWEADHLTAYVSVKDTTPAAGDHVEFSVGTTNYSVPRSGAAAVPATVTEQSGGYAVVAQLPLSAAKLGDNVQFDARIVDGTTTTGWNTPGVLGTLSLIEPLSYLETVGARTAPTIDGLADTVWNDATAVTTSKLVSGANTGATASVKTLWKGSTLYVLADVTDPTVDVSGSDPWVQDSVEIFLDAGNHKNGSYRYDDTQIRISATNKTSFGTGDEAYQQGRLQSATTPTPTGYRVEAAISLLEEGGLGTFHGLDFQVNDGTAGARTSIHGWADPTGNGYQTTARWGVGRLIAAPDAATPPVADGTALPAAGQGGISVPAVATTTGTVTVDLGTANAGVPVDLWLFSTPSLAFSGPVPANGKIVLPAGIALGDHRVAAYRQLDGTLIGWAGFTVVAPLTNTQAPQVVGDAYKGAKVTATPGTWSAANATFTYQWLLDGKPVGAKSADSSYTIKSSDVGKKLSVAVTATVTGLDPVSATSAAVTVLDKKPVPPPVKKVASVTIGLPNTLLGTKSTTIKFTVNVLTIGVAPTGTVTVYDGDKAVGTATLKATDKGTVTVTLGKLKSGLHKLSATYEGSDTVKASESPWLPVLIL